MGAVLSQVQDGHERVIGYYSKTLSNAERNYCVTRRELLAVAQAVKHSVQVRKIFIKIYLQCAFVYNIEPQ